MLTGSTEQAVQKGFIRRKGNTQTGHWEVAT